MLLPVMLLASGCQIPLFQGELKDPEEWYRGMISDSQGEVRRALKSACFPDVAKDVFSGIRNPSGAVELVEELPTKSSEGWTPLKIRMVVDGQEVLIDRHLTGPYMIYSDKIDRMLTGEVADVHTNRSSQPYCFNILLGDDDSSSND